MIKQRILSMLVVMVMAVGTVLAQNYTGITGLVHVPTAETAKAGTFSVGGHWRNRNTLPENFFVDSECGVYDSWQAHLGAAVFDCFELSYSILLFKIPRYNTDYNDIGYYAKDQQFCAKLRLLPEGKWWPAVAIGGTDLFTSAGPSNQYQASYYGAATKTFDFCNQQLKATLAYRHWRDPKNSRWEGLVGGVEYRPSFVPQMTAMAEWTGAHVNLGLNATLFRHVFLQASLLNWRWPSAGIAFTGNLF